MASPTIQYDKLPNGGYRALAVGTDYAYGLEYRATGKNKDEAKANLIKKLREVHK